MADPTVDPGILSKLLEWAWAGVLALGGIVYKTMKGDFETHRREDRENFIALFKGQETINHNLAEGFRGLDKTINGVHVDVLNKINEKADR